MQLLPFGTFVIETSLEKEQVFAALAANIETGEGRGVWKKSSNKEFGGLLAKDKFEIKRLITYKNSFKPLLQGSIANGMQGTRIIVKTRIDKFALVFMSIWLGGIGLFTVLVIADAFTKSFDWYMLIPLFLFLFGYGSMMGRYLFEVANAKNKLLRITGGTLV